MLAPLLLAFLLPLSSAQATSVNAADPNLSACAPALDLISSCSSVISTFGDLSPQDRVSCLCYNQQSSWVPNAFDIPFSGCIAYASTADTSDYPGLASQADLCSRVGDILTSPASGAASTTESPSSTVDSSAAATTSGGTSTPTLTNLPPTTSAGAGIASTSTSASAKATSSAGAGTATTAASTSAKPTVSGSGGNSMMKEWSGKGVALLFGIAVVGFAAF